MQSHDEYEISFPPGSMGLELEPVIKSSERELGCRVKDFYFGDDYDGIPPEKLQDMVHIGDIICSVNGLSVKSLPFVEVVDQLRNLKSQQRIVRFKDIAASWSRSATLTFTPTSSVKVHSPKKQAHSHVKTTESKSRPPTDENVVNQQSVADIMTSPKRSTTTPRRKFGTERQHNKPQSLSQVMDEYPDEEEMRLQSPITPSAIRKSGKNKTAAATSKQQAAQPSQVAKQSVPSMINVQQQLSEAGLKLGEKAVEASITASSMLAMTAHEAITSATRKLPYYSQQEMLSIEHKKNQLLHELSQSVYELRTIETVQFENHKLTVLNQQQAEQIKTLLTHQVALQDKLSTLRSEAKEEQEGLQERLQKEAVRSQQDLSSTLQQHEQDRLTWERQVTLLQSQISELQTEKYELQEAQTTTVQTLSTEMKLLQEGHNRVVEGLQQSTESMRQSLLDKQHKYDVLAQELSTCQHSAILHETTLHTLEKELSLTGKQLSETQHVLLLSTLTQDSQEAQLKSKCCELEAVHTELQNMTLTVQTQADIIANGRLERELLVDKIHILALTITAQQAELLANQTDEAARTAETAHLQNTLRTLQTQIKQDVTSMVTMAVDRVVAREERIAVLQAEVQASAEHVAALELRVQASADLSTAFHANLTASEAKTMASEVEISLLQNKVDKLQIELTQSEDKIKQARAELTELQTLTAHQAEVQATAHQQELDQTCTIFTEQVALLQESIQALKIDSANKGIAFVQSIESIEAQRSAELHQLQCQLTSTQAMLTQAIMEKEQWNLQADSACEDLLHTRVKLSMSEAQSNKLELSLHHAAQQAAAAAAANKKAVADNDQRRAHCLLALHTQLSLLRTILSELKQDCITKDDLHLTMITSYTSQISELHSCNKQQTDAISQLSTQLRQAEKNIHEQELAFIQRVLQQQVEVQRLRVNQQEYIQEQDELIDQLAVKEGIISQLQTVLVDIYRLLIHGSDSDVVVVVVPEDLSSKLPSLLQDYLTSLKEEVAGLRQTLLTVQADCQQQAIAELQLQLAHSKEEHKAAILTLKDAQQQVESEYNSTIALLRREHETVVNALTIKHALVDNVVVALRQEIVSLTQINAFHAADEDNNTTIANLQVHKLQAEVVANSTSQQAEAHAQQQAQQQAQEELEHLHSTIQDLQQQLTYQAEDEKDKVAELQAQVRSLQQQIVYVVGEHSTAMTEYNSTIALLRRQHETLAVEHSANTAQVIENDHEKIVVAELQQQLTLIKQEHQQAIQALQYQLDHTKEEHKAAVLALHHTQQQAQQQAQHQLILKQEHEKAVKNYQHVIADLQADIQALQQQLADQVLKDKSAELQAQLQALQQQLAQVKDEHNTAMLALQQEAKQFTQEQMQTTMAEYNSTIALLQRQHEQDLTAFTQTNTKLSHQLLESSVQAGELETALRDAQQQQSMLKSQVQALEHVLATQESKHVQQIAQYEEAARSAAHAVCETEGTCQAACEADQAARQALADKDNLITALTTRNTTVIQDYRQHILELHISKEAQAELANDQIQSLRDAMVTMQQALTLADDREREVQTILTAQRTQYSEQIAHYRTAVEHAQRTAQLAAQGLQRKQRELDSLLLHVQELLKTTQSPVKAPAPPQDNSPMSLVSPGNKENDHNTATVLRPTSRGSKLSVQEKAEDSGEAGTDDEFIIGEENEWHDTLLLQSLSLHELLSYTGLTLLQCKDSARVHEMFKKITEVHHKLHCLLVRPPWVSVLSVVPSLSPAFSSSSSHAAAATAAAADKTPGTAAVEEDGKGFGEYEEQFHVLMNRLKTLESSASSVTISSEQQTTAATARMLQLEAQDIVIIQDHDETQDNEAELLGSPILLSAEKVSFYISPLRSIERSEQKATSNDSDGKNRRQLPKALVFTSSPLIVDDSLLVSDDDDISDAEEEDELRRLLMMNNSQEGGLSFEESLLDLEVLKAELL